MPSPAGDSLLGGTDTVARQTGQAGDRRSHGSTQAAWNAWPQGGSARHRSPARDASRQTTQVEGPSHGEDDSKLGRQLIWADARPMWRGGGGGKSSGEKARYRLPCRRKARAEKTSAIMRRQAPKAKRRKSASAAVITQPCTPMEMTRAQTPAERAGRQRRLAASGWGCSGAAEDEADASPAAGGAIRGGDL